MIVPTLARMLIREHIYRPIKGKILTLGRQTIAMTYEQFIQLLKQENFPVSEKSLKDIEDKYDNLTRAGRETNFISDEIFFDLLGIKNVNVMDVSSYEGADILHDLNHPIPASLEGSFDFIVDGGTFDHLLDLRVAFENVVRLLKPGGRVFQWNAASNFTGGAYLSLGPDIFYDYYSLNKFADCKVYLAAVDDMGQGELWDLYEFSGDKEYGYFYSKRILMTVVLAEKGPDSTFGRIPVQSQYRDAHLRQIYTESQNLFALSGRKSYQGTCFGVKLRRAKIQKPKSDSLFTTVSLKYKENGLKWVFLKCLKRIERYIRKQVTGFRYIGKI
jgi:SAM-dependent methyltransferase